MFLLVFLMLSTVIVAEIPFSIEYSWNYADFEWERKWILFQNPRENAEEQEKLNLENYFMAGLKMDKNNVYIAMPRGPKKARITLASFSKNTVNKENIKLNPFPNWDYNLWDSCVFLQNVLSMDIDKYGVMWILDGKRDINITKCPPKIYRYDLRFRIMRSVYNIPDEICSLNKKCFVNDIVIDEEYAYMSDTTSTDPGIIVYNYLLNVAWKFRNKLFYGQQEAANFKVQGYILPGVQNINGIALSPPCDKDRTFYFSCLSGYNLYSIKTSILKNRRNVNIDITKFITDHGKKPSQSSGMVADSANNLYFGLQTQNAVAKWDTSKPLVDNIEILSQDEENLFWPDSAYIDDEGNLFYLTNCLPKIINVGLNVTETNFRIVKWYIGNKNYHYCTLKK